MGTGAAMACLSWTNALVALIAPRRRWFLSCRVFFGFKKCKGEYFFEKYLFKTI